MKVGYVLKKFPRLSETFILNELLALEAAGLNLEVISIREPDDEPVHPALSLLKADITYLRPLERRSLFRHMDDLWRSRDTMAHRRLGYLTRRLDLEDPWRNEALGYVHLMQRLIAECGITHLHAHFATSAVALAGETSALTGVPFSFTMHAKDIYRQTVSFRALEARMRASAGCVTVCEANARWLRTHCADDACRALEVIHNGIDLAEWPAWDGFRERDLVVAVGRLIEKKGFDDLIRACGLAFRAGAPFRVLLVGNGEEEAALRRLADDLGLGAQVRFAGAQTQDEVRKHIRRAALVAAPCVKGSDGNQDALPTVLLEAMASATPCVATAVGGIQEIVRSPEEGWIVPERDPEKLAETIVAALADGDRRAAIGRQARRRIETDFDLHRNVLGLLRLFRSSSPAPCAVGGGADEGVF